MKILCYFTFIQFALAAGLWYNCKVLQEFVDNIWVSDDSVRNGFFRGMTTYAWTFGIGSVVMLMVFSYWLATKWLPQFEKFQALQWMFWPIAVGYLTAYVTIFDSSKICRLLKDPETRSKAMTYPIMRKPTIMRKFWAGIGIGLATGGVATMMMLEFLN